MSNEKNVYYGEYSNIEHYSIGVNIPGLFDYPAYYKAEIARRKNRASSELVQKVEELSTHEFYFEKANHDFRKLEVLPDSLWISNHENDSPKEKDLIFRISSNGIIFREEVATIFNQFRLGQTTLIPVKIYIIETGEQWSNETFYVLNLCEQREYVCFSQPDNGLKAMTSGENKLVYTGYVNKDRKLDVSESALECDVDIWYDPSFLGKIFMSENLHQVLVESELIKCLEPNVWRYWNMQTCNLV
ncbi:hypothetical protein [Suttonella indologenes]|uniref:Uncharacterized protein n=1 Tax=Suttonella indologenes TaxID=13276 RepID=A0A380N0Y9_9GAMM|nr:hypothetical protein [Suttonella indologenes]SUO98459.1 Uncharacterised protein [Suttonella indologenes]